MARRRTPGGQLVLRPERRGPTRASRRDGCLFFQAEDGIRDLTVTGVQTCALPISESIGDAQQAVQWALDERPALRAAIELAVKGSYYPHAWQLSRAAAWFFNSEEHWEDRKSVV